MAMTTTVTTRPHSPRSPAQQKQQVALYIPRDLVYRIRLKALNERRTFTDLALQAFNDFIESPRSVRKPERRDEKKVGMYYPYSIFRILRDMARDYAVSFNDLIVFLLKEKYT
jgi:hypothetical protein